MLILHLPQAQPTHQDLEQVMEQLVLLIDFVKSSFV
jgi:hypothetical protein